MASPALRRDQIRDVLAVVDVARQRAPLTASPLYGERHWQAVARIGARLVSETPGSDLYTLLIFAVLHDSARETEAEDPYHASRAFDLAVELERDGLIHVEIPYPARLFDVINQHSLMQAGVGLGADPLYGACLDADRLCVGRLGGEPDPWQLCTEAGRSIPGWIDEILSAPLMDWRELIEQLVESTHQHPFPEPEPPRAAEQDEQQLLDDFAAHLEANPGDPSRPRDTRPLQYLWVHDTATGEVVLADDGDDDVLLFEDLATQITGPSRLQGYAMPKPRGTWAIYDEGLESVPRDVGQRVADELFKRHPPAS